MHANLVNVFDIWKFLVKPSQRFWLLKILLKPSQRSIFENFPTGKISGSNRKKKSLFVGIEMSFSDSSSDIAIAKVITTYDTRLMHEQFFW